MVEIKRITKEELQDAVVRMGFVQRLTAKDYYVTVLLYLLKDVKGIYFKGGTALQKIFLNYSRLSEDVDFTVTREISELKKEITKIINDSNLFKEVTRDKRVHDFVRLIAHYKDPFGEQGTVFIDLNKRAKTLLPPESYEIPHFYPDQIPKFKIKTLNKKELFAEKMAATIGRNKPRDHFDLYQLIKHKHNIDLDLVKKKCDLGLCEFDITKMFNRAKKLKNKWDQDMLPLLSEEVSFTTVMKTLSKQFRYAQEKEKKKQDT